MSDPSGILNRGGPDMPAPEFDNGCFRLTFCPTGAAGLSLTPLSPRLSLKLTEEL